MSKRLRRLPVRLDMTPMVDIAFLLLIFYMATTQFKPPEAKSVELPESHSQIELPDNDAICVTITVDTTILIDWMEQLPADPVSGEPSGIVRRVLQTTVDDVAAGIRRALAARYEAGGKMPFLVIKADRSVPYGIFDSVATSMQEADLNRFLAITDPRPQDNFDIMNWLEVPSAGSPEERPGSERNPDR